MENTQTFWRSIGQIILWIQTENKFIVLMTIIGTMVTMFVLYVVLTWIIPAAVSAAVKRIRRTKFVRRVDRLIYMIQKEHGRKPTPTKTKERVIQTLRGNLNGSR